MRISVELGIPGTDPIELSEEDAIRRFKLDPWDIETIKEGKVLFLGETALSLAEDVKDEIVELTDEDEDEEEDDDE